MLVALGFCDKDQQQAYELLQWCEELGGCRNHELMLIADGAVQWTVCTELIKAATGWRRVHLFTTDPIINEDPRKAWIEGSNELFKQAAMRAAGQPFFWLEPDAIPLKPMWLDQIERSYNECGHGFMGALVKHQTPGYPSPYLEGPAVYPSDCWKRFEPLWDRTKSWCFTCAPAAVADCENSPLIHQIWGEMGIGVSFVPVRTKDSAPQDWTLDMIKPQAVVFHRNKDGSLIKLLREKNPGYGEPPVFVQMGRVGDLILLLPAFKAWADRTGQKIKVVTSREFGTVLEGASYVQPIMLNMSWYDAGKARQWAQARYPRVIVTQLHGAGLDTPPDSLPSYSLTMWERTGLLAEYRDLPVVFDRRDAGREAQLLAAHLQDKQKPVLLVKFDGWTSPFDGGPAIKKRMQHWGEHFQIIDLDHVAAHRAYDFLAFYDIATGLVTGDTMTLHLAAASDIQYVAFVRNDKQSGSIPKNHCVLQIGYEGWDHAPNIEAFDLQLNLWSKHPKLF
jgi:hypothetical protein